MLRVAIPTVECVPDPGFGSEEPDTEHMSWEVETPAPEWFRELVQWCGPWELSFLICIVYSAVFCTQCNLFNILCSLANIFQFLLASQVPHPHPDMNLSVRHASVRAQRSEVCLAPPALECCLQHWVRRWRPLLPVLHSQSSTHWSETTTYKHITTVATTLSNG